MNSARLVWSLMILSFVPGSWAALQPGLNGTYTSLSSPARIVRDVVIGPPQCYVPAGQSPTTLLPPGRFNVNWRGFLSVELRSEYSFQANVQGAFQLLINGETVLETKATNSPLSKPIRLRKGTNEIVAILDSAPVGPTSLQLHWTDNQTALRPIPLSALSHASDVPGLERANDIRTGRELFIEFRCGKCHANSHLEKIPEAAMDAPNLEEIGRRRKKGWLEHWLRDPHAVRPDARMPALLSDAGAETEAKALAAYLSSLGGDRVEAQLKIPDTAREQGERLFTTLLCGGCHVTPGSEETPAGKTSLAGVNAKFNPESLRQYLKQPEQHYRWIRMPNFHLSDEETIQLTAYLTQTAAPAGAIVETEPANKEMLQLGQLLVQSRGCLNCHQMKLENTYIAPGLATIPIFATNGGCLAEMPEADIVTPRFGFTDAERSALRVFVGTDRESLGRHVSAEFAQRQSRLLNCRGCHGQQEGFPALEPLGEKLKPEWMSAFVAGTIRYKPRPWLEARMPSFPAFAGHLAAGLAAAHGFSPTTPSEPPVDPALARIGQALTGKENGFSCISCHAIGAVKPTEVFEGEGNDLTRVGERLQPDYFRRWLLDPLLIDPQTKMPDYFEGFSSPFTEILAGDAPKQIHALWQYFRLGEKMPLPQTSAPQ